MRRTYAKRSKQSEDTIAAWMKRETWFDANAALQAGLADEIAGDLRMAAAAFDLSMFEHPPVPAKPKTAQEAAVAYWAGRRGTPAPVGKDDISDLVPRPKTHEEIWAKFNAEGRGRRRD